MTVRTPPDLRNAPLRRRRDKMNTLQSPGLDAIVERPAAFRTSDGFRLAGNWFEPISPRRASTAVLIVSGAGIPARYYEHFARYLAARGAAVLTFDYRGIAASREGTLRKFKAG